jgi:hypothetical protein
VLNTNYYCTSQYTIALANVAKMVAADTVSFHVDATYTTIRYFLEYTYILY